MARPNQLHQVDVFAMMPAKFGIDKTVTRAACAWELESEMEARGVEPLFRQIA
jgi:hypothetical protein